MLILSNALTNVVDEGCIKIANNLVKRIKKADESTFVVAFERISDLADEYVTVNKLLLNRKLISKIKQNKGSFMYIPFPAKTRSVSLRIFILSLFARRNFSVILCMTSEIDVLSKLLFKMSRAKFVVFSKRSFELYSSVVSEKKVEYLRIGVDIERFVPALKDTAEMLKEKYGFDPRKKLVLHVGHLNKGRNIQQLEKLTKEYQVLLVTSTQTQDEQDMELKKELIAHGISIIDTYIPDIEEIYQMADVYFFPVLEQGHCIDVPLSCLEAAACNKPIVTTDFGEMREFVGKKGFYFIESFEQQELLLKIRQALEAEVVSSRQSVLEYDWSSAIEFFISDKENLSNDYYKKAT